MLKITRFLYTSLALAVLSACADPKRIVEATPIPAERMDCVAADTRPAIPPEHKIEWANVSNVLQARQEYNQYVASVRAREGMVAGYVLELEGKLFLCANDAAWLREWQAGIQ